MSLGLEIVIDRLIGFVLTTLTGMPVLDTIKDLAQLGVIAVKVSNSLATTINKLRPALN
jgi:hypothetical protein